MASFMIKRIGLALITIFGVLLIVFICSRLSGDVVYLLLGDDATAADIQNMRVQLGLDQPILVQFLKFLVSVAHGNFERSFFYKAPVLELIVQRLPATFHLAVLAFLITVVLGPTLGMIAAINRGTWIDSVLRGFSSLGMSMPSFWLGLMFMIIFAVMLGWLPTSGANGWKSYILPSVTLAMTPMASVIRLTRSSALETMGSEYVQFLRAKGVREWRIIWLHVMRNAAIPVIAMMGIQLGHLLGGSVVVESVFAWPGFGRLMVEALVTRDYAVIQAGAILVSFIVISLNLIVDLLFGFVDPRIRYS